MNIQNLISIYFQHLIFVKINVSALLRGKKSSLKAYIFNLETKDGFKIQITSRLDHYEIPAILQLRYAPNICKSADFIAHFTKYFKMSKKSSSDKKLHI